VKVARTVLNGGDEETGHTALRLVPTQLPRCGYQRRLKPSVRLLETDISVQRPAAEATRPEASHLKEEESTMWSYTVGCLVTLALLMAPLAADAQPAGNVRRIGWLRPGDFARRLSEN